MSADPNADILSPRARLVRSLASAVAAVLGIAALVLIVFSTSQKQIEIGVLLGFWAGLIAAFLAFGSRRHVVEGGEVPTSLVSQVVSQVAELRESQDELRQSHEELRSSQIELVKVQTEQANTTIELRQRVEQARTSEIVDPDLLRRELSRLLTEQIGSLRDEIAGLRADIVEKAAGEVRLERIETTRVVGADLETLQREIRTLTTNQNRTIEAPIVLTPAPSEAPTSTSTPSPTPAAAREEIIVEAHVDEAGVVETHVEEAHVDEVYVDDSPAIPHVTADAFANLPRLSPVPAEVVDLIFDEAGVPEPPRSEAATPESEPEPEPEPLVEWRERLAERMSPDKPYVGRRRAMDASAAGAAATTADTTPRPDARPASSPGGRRRAPADHR